MKLFCFRFDVDTYLCARKGVPNLISLANDLGVRFTFFFNMGKSVSYISYLPSSKENSSHKLSIYKKLGFKECLRTVLINPLVGLNFLSVIENAKNLGHEIGLHGGRNHAVWMREAHKWSMQEFEKEIDWGLSALRKAHVDKVVSFASPGWKNNENIYPVLAKKGIFTLADLHGFGIKNKSFPTSYGKVINVVTEFSGEPGGVGYIENQRAKGLDDDTILYKFKEQIVSIGDFAMIYDHPCFAGTKEIGLLRKMIILLQNEEFSIMPLSLVLSKTMNSST